MCTICILQALKYICQKDDQESQAYKKWEKNFLLSQTSKMHELTSLLPCGSFLIILSW